MMDYKTPLTIPARYTQNGAGSLPKDTLSDAWHLASPYSAYSQLVRSAVLALGILFSFSFLPAYSEGALNSALQTSEHINLDVIAQIESSGNASAIGDGGKALGLYQIHPPVIIEYNRAKHVHKAHSCALEPRCATQVAEWYLGVRIPQILHWMKKPVTTQNILICWNAGCGRIANPPAIIRNYLAKYERLTKEAL